MSRFFEIIFTHIARTLSGIRLNYDSYNKKLLINFHCLKMLSIPVKHN